MGVTADSIETLVPDLVEIRHYLHTHPELSDHEAETAAFVESKLRPLGLEIKTGIGGNGIVADLIGSHPGPTTALRADMDALPIQEQSNLPYKSSSSGVMHACGHDGHTTVLLGTARLLAQQRSEIRGTVRFIFQPAEETTGGAERMCAEGCMDGVDQVYALHGWPGLEVGKIAIRKGPMMASSDTFYITIRGKQAHAAYPHLSIDPIIVGSHMVTALQAIVSRNTNPSDSVVVTVGKFIAGTATNIISETAEIAGTIRTLSPELRKSVAESVRHTCKSVAATFGATMNWTYRLGTPPVINHPDAVDHIASAANTVLGLGNVVELPHPSMGAEDFASYLDYAPGAMFRLGIGDTTALHTPTFNFTDAAIPVGVKMFAELVRQAND
ncbi:MAG: M20 family metallopeptidase [Chthonomonadales bacterium]